jgi:hypothetical protein
LLLAVAGGLFAQVTWGGYVYTDLTAKLEDKATDWGLDFGTMTGRFQATYRNDAGTFGGRVRLQAAINATSFNTLFSVYYGWFTMFDGKLKVLGGKWTDGEFYEGAYWADEYLWLNDSYGVMAILYPVDGISVGFGLHSSGFGAKAKVTAAPGLYYIMTGTDAGKTTTTKPTSGKEGVDYITIIAEKTAANAVPGSFDNLRYWVGLAYNGDNLGVYAQGDFQKDNVNAALNGYYEAGDVLAALSVAFNRLDSFDPNGSITIREAVDYTGIENLDVSLESAQTFYGAANKDADTTIDLGVGYTVDVAGINLVGINIGTDLTAETLYFNPYVRFGQGGSRYLRLDYTGEISFNGGFENTIRLRFYWSF